MQISISNIKQGICHPDPADAGEGSLAFSGDRQFNIQKHSEMFRFAQHDAKAIVILSEAKDLGNFP